PLARAASRARGWIAWEGTRRALTWRSCRSPYHRGTLAPTVREDLDRHAERQHDPSTELLPPNSPGMPSLNASLPVVPSQARRSGGSDQDRRPTPGLDARLPRLA